MTHHLRVARPVSDLGRTEDMYRRGLGLRVIGRFDDHDGFDGVLLATRESSYHFEFTRARAHPVDPAPTVEDLIVLYIADEREWRALCADMVAAGFRVVESFNPYWDLRGRTYEDGDGYRVVLQNAGWPDGD